MLDCARYPKIVKGSSLTLIGTPTSRIGMIDSILSCYVIVTLFGQNYDQRFTEYIVSGNYLHMTHMPFLPQGINYK